MDWGTLIVAWIVCSFPIFGLSAVRQMRRRGETEREESQYNLLILLWMFGFVPLLALQYSEKADPSLGVLWLALYVIGALLFWRYRVELKRAPGEFGVVRRRTGLRVLLLSAAALAVLFLADDALLDLLPYTGFADARDLVSWRWAHAVAAVGGLWGAYLYLGASIRK